MNKPTFASGNGGDYGATGSGGSVGKPTFETTQCTFESDKSWMDCDKCDVNGPCAEHSVDESDKWREKVANIIAKSFVIADTEGNGIYDVLDVIENLLSEERNKEVVICSAIRMPDGYIVRGHRHHNCIQTANDIPRYKGIHTHGEDHGFVTSLNRYVTRKEGYEIQKKAGIPSFLEDKHPEDAFLGGELYSEDLY